ncbi:DUF305 domain-containing protein [Mesorhizobium sp. ES1-4]|uniref:DUF305 domain-containing protein n=1 Tax=Mesorhizobium sp. ES1-4 TaxID=2876627 RepID=UPI00398C5023
MFALSSRKLALCVGGILVAAAASYAATGKDSGSAVPTGTSICSAGGTDAAESERPFLTENQRAMDKMMTGMAVKPTGDVDVDFAAMMIPHHQGAIDMAVLQLRFGRNEQLRRIAQEIIVDQQQEIAAMRLALGQPLPPSVSAPTESGDPAATDAPTSPADHTMKDMPK